MFVCLCLPALQYSLSDQQSGHPFHLRWLPGTLSHKAALYKSRMHPAAVGFIQGHTTVIPLKLRALDLFVLTKACYPRKWQQLNSVGSG